MERRKFLKTLTLTSGALALGPQLYARSENILFQQLRELNQRLPLQRSYGIYHPAITGIRIAKKDYASLAKNTQTPEVTFENVPDFNGVPQPRCGLYRWVMISVTGERCISGCIRFVSAGDLFYSTHDFIRLEQPTSNPSPPAVKTLNGRMVKTVLWQGLMRALPLRLLTVTLGNILKTLCSIVIRIQNQMGGYR